MEKEIQRKMESLQKYVPFIDFVIEIDEQKYIKFKNIRKWIVLKTKYPLSALNKIEQSIITQYKNLLIENNVRIPQNILNIFAPNNFNHYVNLCSDEEEDVAQEFHKKKKHTSTAVKPNASKKSLKQIEKYSKINKVEDSDDDLEIVSVNYVNKYEKEIEPDTRNNLHSASTKVVVKQDVDINGISKDLLSKIDKLAEDDIKMKSSVHEPINYTYQEKNYCDITEDNSEPVECVIFQRRISSDTLFKRRTDFKDEVNTETDFENNQETKKMDYLKDDEVEVQCIQKINNNVCAKKSIEIISLDSCSDGENCCDDDYPSTSKAAAIKNARNKKIVHTEHTALEEKTNKIEQNKNINSNSSNKKVDLLCNSIDSVFLDMNEFMDELKDSNETYNDQKAETSSSNKENNMQPSATNNSHNLNQEQIFKLFEDISNTKDFDMDTFCAALSYVKQMNTTSSKTNPLENNYPLETPTETPSPPPISNNLSTPPVHPLQQQSQQAAQYSIIEPKKVYYPGQQPHYITPPLTPHYPQNVNFVTTAGVATPPRPKININDPRIMKQLQAIQNSPLFTHNVLNSETAASIMQICQSQKFQQPQQQQRLNCQTSSSMHPHNINMAAALTTNNFRKTTDTASSNSITYGEYKRRQHEQKLQLERKREEERKAKAEKEVEREKQELLKKKEEEIRLQIFSTLAPCKDQLTTMWSQQKNLTTTPGVSINKTTNVEQEKQEDKQKKVQKITTKATMENNNKITLKKVNRQTQNNSNNNKNNADTSQSKTNNVNQKLNRVYNELKCTFKGFDQLHDYIPTVGQSSFGKAKNMRQNITNDLESDSNSSLSTEKPFTPRPIGLMRRSSIHALSAISEQLGQLSSDCSDCDINQKNVGNHTQLTVDPKRRLTDTITNSTSESSSQDFMQSVKKRRKTIDEVIKPTRRSKTLRIVDDDSASCCSLSSQDEITSYNSKEILLLNQPVIKLQRISQEFIRKHTKSRKEETDQSSRLKKNFKRITNAVEPAQKLSKFKKYNNDCQMTERNTSFCALCRSKPSDLTNHYIGRHKTESYVSRLDWSELDDLSINTPFANLIPKTKNYRFDRYEVECPFCKEKIVDQFLNLYHHYSAHTGEYAFQCSHCHLTKPYRPDIQSHILHSKTCRSSTINTLYRYPPSAQCIYLHFCIICNFVQLNEANVLKHLREHHASSEAIPSNVQKYILAAMSDGPDVNEVNKPSTPAPASPVQKETTVDIVESIPPPAPRTVQKETTVDKFEMIQEKLNSTTACSSNAKELELNGVKLHIEQQQPTTSYSNFKIDDDDIPVTNEPCLEEEFLEGGKYSLEEQLKQLHEGPASTINTQPPMTVIHCFGNHLKDSSTRITLPPKSDRHPPMIIKTEHMDVEENLLITPTRPSSYKMNEAKPITPLVARNQSAIYEKYRGYPQNVNYLGLYKCMIDDCYYSTDCSEDLCTHLTDHSSGDLNPIESLQCPYCDLPTEMPINPLQLAEHVRSQHEHLIYQCSMCCYRSCDASNVHVHQQFHHSTALDSCNIYKCSNNNLKENLFDLNEQIVKSVLKILCSVCNKGFYHTQLLINHLNSEHKVHDVDGLTIYSCIYCPLTMANKNEIRLHIATKHPDKLPYVYDHNTQCNSINEDVIRSLDIVCLSESVAYEEIRSVLSDSNEENIPQDIKPDVEKLVQMNEEIIRARLRKLTAHTGIPPDKLYHCPIPSCGGFFSIFDLWLRHMKVRHLSLECECPHCPVPRPISLEQFSLHFEEHRRHTFICFHCPTTCPNETLAQQHFSEKHTDLGIMRFEQIHFNLCYSYSIMMQSDLYKEREHFITEFLVTLDNRLNVLESSEMQKLKLQWLVQENAEWIEDYLQLLQRRVLRNCLVKDCKYRTSNEDKYFIHLRTSHGTQPTLFNCSQCEHKIKLCGNFGEVINHIKLHSKFICICTACSLSTSSRSKMCTHIRDHHSARDVPVIQLFKTNQLLFIKIYIVFSDNHLTFSTMKNCFCCPEKNMNGDVFSLHLKRYHKFSLNYYCEKCSFHFKSLKDAKSHFQQLHPFDKLKLRCELSSPNDLIVTSLNEFQVQISTGSQLPLISSLNIKDEPESNTDNDDVILLDDNDIVIQDSLSDEQLQPKKEIPKLKCTSLSKLLQPSSSSVQPNCLPVQRVFHQPSTSVSSAFPTASILATSYDKNNLTSLNYNTNLITNHANTSSDTPRVSTNLVFCNTLLSGYMPLHNKSACQIAVLPQTPTNDLTNSNYSIQHVPSNLYVGQTSFIQTPGNNSISSTTAITQNYGELYQP